MSSKLEFVGQHTEEQRAAGRAYSKQRVQGAPLLSAGDGPVQRREETTGGEVKTTQKD